VPDEDSLAYLNARYHKLCLIGLEAFFADLEDRIGHLPSDGLWDGVIQRLRAILFCCAPSATSRQMQEATVIWTSRDGVSASFHLGSLEARRP
jgi:hypothetical protein